MPLDFARGVEWGYEGASAKEWPRGGWAECYRCRGHIRLRWMNGLAYLSEHEVGSVSGC